MKVCELPVSGTWCEALTYPDATVQRAPGISPWEAIPSEDLVPDAFFASKEGNFW